ncbi:MAG: SDR family NAD(P)-dependent oxidoreductase, partial [Burkholderiales bacterium]|nr:SDR family NAD(P)-dependent oxidoreductase [Burkholderiales bacterium]
MPLNSCIKDWQGRRVWVIGASSGIGKAFAEAVLKSGARVALSARDSAALEKIASQFLPEQSLVLPVDVTDHDDVERAFSRLRQAWSSIDLVVLLAGTHL